MLLFASLGALNEDPPSSPDPVEQVAPVSTEYWGARLTAAASPSRSDDRTTVTAEVEVHEEEEPSEPEPSPRKATAEHRHYDVGAVQPYVQVAADEVGTLFGVQAIGGFAYRSNPDSDHPKGLALDFMVDRATGDAIAAHFIEYRERYRVKYIIWRQQINSLDGRGWRWMEDRGGATANHYDHVHVSFLS